MSKQNNLHVFSAGARAKEGLEMVKGRRPLMDSLSNVTIPIS
jgi:hypothetical protein